MEISWIFYSTYTINLAFSDPSHRYNFHFFTFFFFLSRLETRQVPRWIFYNVSWSCRLAYAFSGLAREINSTETIHPRVLNSFYRSCYPFKSHWTESFWHVTNAICYRDVLRAKLRKTYRVCRQVEQRYCHQQLPISPRMLDYPRGPRSWAWTVRRWRKLIKFRE